MPDLADGESIEMQGSGAKPYVLKNTGGVYSCTCPAWRNQSIAIERRTCKHLRKLRGDAAEEARIGGALPAPRQNQIQPTGEDDDAGPRSCSPNLGQRRRPHRLVDQRKARRRPRLLGRQAVPLPRWATCSTPPIGSSRPPRQPLDGELWIDRKKFQRTVSIVRRQDKSDLWKEVRFLVFDAPSSSRPSKTASRLSKTPRSTPPKPTLRPTSTSSARTWTSLAHELARVEALGGEGLMLRQPGSQYDAGRSSTLLKVKSFHDAEARVLGHLGRGRPAQGPARRPARRARRRHRFSVGTGFSDAERGPRRRSAPITFRYQELSDGGVPRFPSFHAVRDEA